MEKNPTIQGGAVETSSEAQATKTETTTLKLISNKCHLGPRQEGLKAKTNLSTATGKVLFNNDMKIVVTGAKDKGTKPTSTVESTTVEMSVGGEVKQAAFYMLAWDQLYSVGTDAYKEKFTALNKARTDAYAALGISSSLDSKRPELTAQQRAIYNEKVLPFSFTYFEYRLSFKQPGKKAVRSKTFRSLSRMDADSMLEHIRAKAVALTKTLEVKPRSGK